MNIENMEKEIALLERKINLLKEYIKLKKLIDSEGDKYPNPIFPYPAPCPIPFDPYEKPYTGPFAIWRITDKAGE